jgi:hypothetical protein
VRAVRIDHALQVIPENGNVCGKYDREPRVSEVRESAVYIEYELGVLYVSQRSECMYVNILKSISKIEKKKNLERVIFRASPESSCGAAIGAIRAQGTVQYGQPRSASRQRREMRSHSIEFYVSRHGTP